MKDWRRWFLAVGGIAVIGGGYLAAQPVTPSDKTESVTTISPIEDASLTVPQMAERAGEIVKKIDTDQTAVRKRIGKTTKDHDVIKLDCLGNADQRLTGLHTVAVDAHQSLKKMSAKERDKAAFQYQKAVVAGELADEATAEAGTCAGGFELSFGDDKLEVDGPKVRDDPTKDKKRTDGFDPTKPENVGQGSPF